MSAKNTSKKRRPSKKPPRLWTEAPIRFLGEAPANDKRAEEILGELEGINGHHGVVVAGLVGGRGSGKTSLLNLVGHAALRRTNRWRVAQSCDSGDEGRKCPVLIEPSRSMKGDSLLYELIEHLAQIEGPGRSELTEELTKLAARQVSPQAFLDLAKELATSNATLPETIAKAHQERARTTQNLRDAFLELIGKLVSKEQRLLLLVDDVDLKPAIALELLETLHELLDHPRLVVLFAFDASLLLHALNSRLDHEHRNGPGLAQALMEKLVPHRWPVHRWSEVERFEFLWPSESRPQEQPESVLPHWWSDDLLLAVGDALRPDKTHRDSISSSGGPADNSGIRGYSQRLLAPLLPSSPRRLKALENELILDLQREERLIKDSKGMRIPIKRPTMSLLEEINVARSNLERASSTPPKPILSELRKPVWTMFRAVETSFPQLRLLETLRTTPATFRRDWQRFTNVSGDFDRLGSWIHELCAPETLTRAQEQEAISVLKQFGDLLNQLGTDASSSEPPTGGTPPSSSEPPKGEGPRRPSAKDDFWSVAVAPEVGPADELEVLPEFLAISVDANARDVFLPWWQQHYSNRGFRDLTLVKPGTPYARAPVSEFKSLLAVAEPELKELAIRRDVPLLIGAKAPLSVLFWIGWRLRYRRLEGCVNDYQGSLQLFAAPPERLRALRAENRLAVDSVEAKTTSATLNSDAVLLVDLLGNSTEADLGRFEGLESKSFRRLRLVRREQTRPEPEDTRPLLQDIIEELQALKDGEVTTIHLALVCPDVLAVMLGHQIHALGRFIVYEWDRTASQYLRAFELEERSEPTYPEVRRR